MKNRKSGKSGSFISDLSANTKSLVINIATLAVIAVVVFAMFRIVGDSQKERHGDMQKMTITVSEELMEMTIESGVAIAKSIYTNGNIYEFLNTEYPTSADYYDAFYEFQQKTPLAIAETNIIERYTVYTENPTILNGGRISSFDSETDKNWYKAYKKLDKPMILFIDSESKTMSLIRKLDFQNISTGESCIKLDLNTSIFTGYCDSFGFDGEIYIISGGMLIYSNVENATIENIGINQDFECYIKNYYTADIEYYACEKRKTVREFVSANIPFVLVFAIITILNIILSRVFIFNMKKRITGATEILRRGERPDKSGKDEIGCLIEVCAEVSERLVRHNSESEKASVEIMRKNSSYNRLFSSALSLSAMLETAEKYPLVYDGKTENITLAEELEKLKQIGVDVKSDESTPVGEIPAFSLVLVASDLMADGACLSAECRKSEIIFSKDKKESPTRILKINAVFESENIPDDYEFSAEYPYNPYLRLKNIYGNGISAETSDTDGFRLIINFNNEKSDC